jgi:hypothetical protein
MDVAKVKCVFPRNCALVFREKVMYAALLVVPTTNNFAELSPS